MPFPDYFVETYCQGSERGELCFETGRGGSGREQVFEGTKRQKDDVDLTLEEWKNMLRKH